MSTNDAKQMDLKIDLEKDDVTSANPKMGKFSEVDFQKDSTSEKRDHSGLVEEEMVA